MAIGDIDGDLPLTNAARTKQTSFDQTNLPAQYQSQGPVGRATQQLPNPMPSLTQVGQPRAAQPVPTAPAGASQASSAPRTSSLSDVGLPPGQTSFDATNTPAQYLGHSTPAPTNAPSLSQVAMPGSGPATSQPSSGLGSVGAPGAAASNLNVSRQSMASLSDIGGPAAAPSAPAAGGPLPSLGAAALPAQPASSSQSRIPSLNDIGQQAAALVGGNSVAQPNLVGRDLLSSEIAPQSSAPVSVPPATQQPAANAPAPRSAAPSLADISSGGVAAPPTSTAQTSGSSAPTATSPASAPSVAAPSTSAQAASSGASAPTLDGFQPTGIGINAQGGQIVGKVGADGAPSFSNDPSAQRDAAGRPTLNGFTGQSNFSVGAPGDAARAMAGYQQLHDMRQQWANEDRLQAALAENTRNSHFNVVHDGSRPLSQQDRDHDRKMDASIDAMRDNSLRNVQLAQAVYDDSVQRQGVQQQQRQASRLEDLQVAAMAPGAPDSARLALQQAMDPTGEKAAARQLTAARTAQANAAAAKDNQLAANGGRKVGNLPVGLQKLEDNDLDALANVKSMDTQLGNIGKQIDNGTLKLSLGGNAWNKALNYTGMSTQESANFSSFQSTMEKMRNDSLRLNKGTQTEGDAVRAWNELFANANDPRVVKQRLGEIQALNAQAAKVRTGMINSRRKNQGIGTLDIDDVLNGTIGLQPGQDAAQQAPQAQQQLAPQPAGQARTQAPAPAAQPQKKDHSALWGG